MEIKALYDKDTFTWTYIVYDSDSRDAVIIDSVMNYDPASSSYSYESVDEIMSFVTSNDLKVHYILETHAHADHLSGSQELQRRLPSSKIAIGSEISKVQEAFKGVFNLPKEFKTDGSQFDVLIKEGENLKAGSLEIEPIHTPGHTPACYSFKIRDALFTGDALFMPDFGVARCDFPKGSAETLFDSITKKLYTLPDSIRVFTGHDYQPGGRDLLYETTIGESKRSNIHINAQTQKADFIEFRTKRDASLSAPRLLLQSVQVNINAGEIPEPENNQMSYLKIPIRRKS